MWAPELPQRFLFTPFFFPKLPVSPVETWMKGAWSQRSHGSPKAEAWWKKPWWLGATLSEQCLFQMLFNWLLWRDLEISESPHSTNNNDQQCFFWSFYVFLHVSNCHGILTTRKKTQHPPQARAATWGTWSTWNTRSTWGHSTKCTWNLWHAWRSLRSFTWVLAIGKPIWLDFFVRRDGFVCLEGKSSGWFPINGYFQSGISVWNNHLKWCHDLFFQPLCGWWKLGRQRQSGAINAMGRCGIDTRWDSWRCKRILFLFYTIACIKSDFNPSFSILWMNWGCGNIHHILWTIPTSWAGLQLSDVFFVGRHFVSLNQWQETA